MPASKSKRAKSARVPAVSPVMSYNKFRLYEQSVQSPDVHVDSFIALYKEIHRKVPRHLREDFCGTFQVSCEWVKKNPKNTVIAIDLDQETLDYGKQHHWTNLTPEQKKRVQIKKANVLTPTTPKIDLIVACNFSFFIFKERDLLVKYFKSCFKSLSQKGSLLLELAGGPGMIASMKERRVIHEGKGSKFTYIWDQISFDPITHDADYAIHFKLPSGKIMKNAFTYDWRLWTIPEVRDALAEAGFSKSCVYWETEHRGKGTGEYTQQEHGDNSFAWIAYVVGSR